MLTPGKQKGEKAWKSGRWPPLECGGAGPSDTYCSAQLSSTNLCLSFHARVKFVTSPSAPSTSHLYLIRWGSCWFWGREGCFRLFVLVDKIKKCRIGKADSQTLGPKARSSPYSLLCPVSADANTSQQGGLLRPSDRGLSKVSC